MVCLQGNPIDVVVSIVYMSTPDHLDDEIEEMYDKIERLMDKGKGNDYVVILGDWNAVVMEAYGLGKRNARGDVLIDLCRRKSLCIANICFEQKLQEVVCLENSR